jgi:hypothetical protein
MGSIQCPHLFRLLKQGTMLRTKIGLRNVFEIRKFIILFRKLCTRIVNQRSGELRLVVSELVLVEVELVDIRYVWRLKLLV